MRYRVNRPLIKQQAKIAFFKNWRTFLLAGLIIVALNLLLTLMRSRFLPQLTMAIPASVLSSPEELSLWTQSWMESTIASLDVNFWLIFGLISLLSLLLTVPLQFGLFQLCWRAAHGEEQLKATFIFTWITDIRRVCGSIGMTIAVYVLGGLWTLLFNLPTIAVALVVLLVPTLSPATLLMLISLLYLLIFAGIFFSLIRTVGYLAAEFNYAGQPERGIRAALRDTKALLKNRRWEFFILWLSFILWNIASSLTYGVADLFVVPYFCMTVILFTEAVRQGPVDAPPVNPWSPSDRPGDPNDIR